MKILAVDDDRIVLDLLEGILASAEYGEVHTCESAERALDLIATEKKPFTCFLLDIQMPGMDGIELCRRIRDIPQHKDTPILMLTSMSEKSYIDRAFSAGASDYLTKPLDATEIIVRLGIAEQLMKERKSLSEGADVIDSLIEVLDHQTQHDLEEAIDLGKMDRLLRYPAFENYLYRSGRGTLFRSTIFAAKVRKAENLHRMMPPLEFKSFLTTAASALIDRLESHEVFITYRGDGEFVGVIPRKGQQVLKALGDEITVAIDESEGPYTAKLPASASLALALAAPILLPTRGELSRAIWTALENVRLKTAPHANQAPTHWIARGSAAAISRLRHENGGGEEDLRAEFAQMLREQLNSEIGEHHKRSRVGNRKSPPSVFKKRQSNAKNTGNEGSSVEVPSENSKKIGAPRF